MPRTLLERAERPDGPAEPELSARDLRRQHCLRLTRLEVGLIEAIAARAVAQFKGTINTSLPDARVPVDRRDTPSD